MNSKQWVMPSFKVEQAHLPFPLLVRFSSRELEIIELLVTGQSNSEMAAALYLSTNTIKTHVRNIMHKLGVERRVQIAVVAVRLDLDKSRLS